MHLLYNLVCLLAMGDMLERMLGAVKYLLIYLGGGIAGNLLSFFREQTTGRYAVAAGASGAICAVIGACLAVMLRHKNSRNQNMIKRLMLMAVLMVAEGFTQSGIDNAAHIGGMAAGFLMGLVLN
ncbi:rhomboid family intramembrane serine protease [uncultured Methanobrevibacter sp.]|uniref:rhomboid family intramembrane serine protease n=1 Tax=uncultured Methanobrevibacter sp. TaxID=253161 RepID=UPI00261D5A62